MDHFKTAIIDLSSRGGLILNDEQLKFLFRDYSGGATASQEELPPIFKALFGGFFAAAFLGIQIVPEHRIHEAFGRSLSENYPQSNSRFMKFATTYWTLKLFVRDLEQIHPNTLILLMLSKIEFTIAAAFFPTPGLIMTPKFMRRKTARGLLWAFWSEPDIEELIDGDPML